VGVSDEMDIIRKTRRIWWNKTEIKH